MFQENKHIESQPQAEVEVTCDWVIYCGRLLMGGRLIHNILDRKTTVYLKSHF